MTVAAGARVALVAHGSRGDGGTAQFLTSSIEELSDFVRDVGL